MSKEKVFIVLSHKHQLKKGARPVKGDNSNWEVVEQVEFVNQIRNKHISMSSAIADYINRKMITGDRYGMKDYQTFEDYARKKYEKQMAELDNAYKADQIKEESPEVFVDQFGNVREKTVFDV
ncbi:MAG TPA: hypothetical protein VIY47_09210 [Ignavibacteriaceae bacterium]